VKRTVGLIIAAALFAAFTLAVGACSSPSKPATSLDRFNQILGHAPTGVAREVALKGQLVVADDGNYPPQSWIDKSGTLQGFDVDVAVKVGELLGVKVAFTNPTWDAVPGGLRTGAFDVSIGSLSPSAELRAMIDFTAPYYYTGGQLAVKQGMAPILSAAGLSGKIVGVGAQTTFFYWLRSHTKATVKTFTTEADAFPELKSGALSAIMAAQPTLKQAIKSGQPFALSGNPLFYQGLSFGVRKGQQDLLAVLDYTIRTMRSDGTLSRLSKEWFNGLDLSAKGTPGP
jgi:polar amino acid transport system substrate-binding protein